MEIDLGPDAEAFRAELRSWIADNRVEGLGHLDERALAFGSGRLDPATTRAVAEWESRLADARLICPHWPEEVGGRGLSGVELAVLNEELHAAGLPRISRGMGESLVGPSVIVHGTDEQKRRILPRIISGEDRYCQGFSEPDQGSDLAGVGTRGVIDGDEIVVSGQKVWTSGAHLANMIFILCRTDPDAPKHRGLSYVLAPMRLPDGSSNGIEIRPLRQMTGGAGFSQEYLSGCRAPLANVIGGLHNGWRVAMTTLGNERGGGATTQHLRFERELWALVDEARARGRAGDPLVRQDLAWAYSHVQLMRFSGLRLLADLANRREPGPEASTAKLFWSEYHRRFGEIAVGIEGAHAMVRPDAPGAADWEGGFGGDEGNDYHLDRWQQTFLSSRPATIYSGTSEIQRNIVGERALGLPKEPAADGR